MRSSNTKEQLIEAIAPQLELQQMMERFNQVGNKLEERYRALQREANDLRRALERKDEELKRNARLAMLGETAAALAHEVRNPLGAMRLFNGLLAQEVADNSSASELCQQLGNCITALDGVVTNILFFAKDAPFNLAPLNLHALITAVGEQAMRMSPQMTISFSLQAENPFILGVEQSLRQVFDNLLRNSASVGASKVQVSITSQRDTVGAMVVTIKDDGPGIPQEILSRLFEPFVTSRPEGTGLGLAVVRRILEQHNASISAQNHNGAVFEIVFASQSKD